MTLIYLVRHGETEWNQEKIFRGRKDIPLSQKGRKEAEALAKALSQERIQFIYSSPLKRAIETAKPLADRLNLSVQICEGFIDLDFGDWEGKSVKEVEKNYPELFKIWEKAPEKIVFPNGESLKLARERAMKALQKVAEENPEKIGAVISHRVICKLAVLSAIGANESNFWRLQQDLACYNLLEWTGRNWIVRLVNETGHLKDVAGLLKSDF